MALDFTGERFVPTACSGSIAYEHWHRYAYAARFVAGKKVLDVASGEGYGADLLAERAASVVGVDIDDKSVEHARQTHARENLHFLQGSAASIPIEGEKIFDVIVSFETIEHIDEASQVAFLNEVKRLLKDDGVFVVSSPDKATYSDAPNFKNEYHVKEFYLDEFRQFLARWFSHVSLVGQAVHGVSYLRPIEAAQGAFTQLTMRNEKGSEAAPPHLYLIALCSNTAAIDAPFSVLLDPDERLLNDYAKGVAWLQGELGRRTDEAKRLSSTLAERDAELEAIKSTLPYRVFHGVHEGLRSVARRLRGAKR